MLRIIFIMLLVACGEGEKKLYQSEANQTESLVQTDTLVVDTLYLTPPELIGDGHLQLVNDSLYFFDYERATVYVFDLEGKYYTRHLGKGQGPNEVDGVQQYLWHFGQHIVIQGWTVNVFDSNWNIQNRFVIDFDVTESERDLLNDPKPQFRGLYEVNYFENRFVSYDTDHVVFTIESTNPVFNAFISKDYYREGRIFARLNLSTGKVDSIFGTRSDQYERYRFIPNHAYHYFDYSDDKFYVNFEPDPSIYVFDKDYQPLDTLGAKGIQMQTNYLETSKIEAAFDANKLFSDRVKDGFYSHIKVFPEKDLIFRIYTTGIDPENAEDYNDNPKRLQVYKDQKLMMDYYVPSYFKLLGESDGRFFSQGKINEESNTIGLYTFQLANRPVQ